MITIFFFHQALISVSIQLSFTDFANENVIPVVNVTARHGTTGFQLLQLASQQNPCYLSEYKNFLTLGHYITSICDVEQNTTSNFYWFIYLNEQFSEVGVDFIKPENGDILKFEHRFINCTDSNPTATSLTNEISAAGIVYPLSKN